MKTFIDEAYVPLVCSNQKEHVILLSQEALKMTQEKLIQFFQYNNLISNSIAQDIANHFTPYSIFKNEYFLKEGKVSNQYFFLEKGFMRSFAYNVEGQDITTGFFSSNQVVFEVASFFNRTPSRENIQALVDCEGWSITFEQLNILFHTLPAFREFGRHILVKGYAKLKERMLSMITDTAETRYEKLLISNADLFQQASLKHIASYLGITDTSLSRIRKELSNK